MNIICDHGYFKFYPEKVQEIARFSTVFNLDLVQKGDYFTFPALLDLENYSVLGSPFGGIPAVKTFAGRPSEVLRANGMIYDFTLDLIRPVLSVVSLITLDKVNYAYSANGLVIPGSRSNFSASQIVDYSAFFMWETQTFKYIGFQYA